MHCGTAASLESDPPDLSTGRLPAKLHFSHLQINVKYKIVRNRKMKPVEPHALPDKVRKRSRYKVKEVSTKTRTSIFLGDPPSGDDGSPPNHQIWVLY